jgi:hypothetical protein
MPAAFTPLLQCWPVLRSPCRALLRLDAATRNLISFLYPWRRYSCSRMQTSSEIILRPMPLIYRNIEPPADYYLLVGAEPDGDIVCFFGGKPVTDVVKDERGYRYVFAGLAPRKYDGSYDVRHMRNGEVIVEPGLIYQLIPVKHGFVS